MTAAQQDDLIELAYMMVIVDGEIAEGEYEAWKEVTAWVRDEEATDDAMLVIAEKMTKTLESASVEERVAAIARNIPPVLRQLALELTICISAADDVIAKEEGGLLDVLVAGLELPEGRADAVRGEIVTAMRE